MVHTFPDIFLWNVQPQLLTCPVEADQAVAGYGRLFAMQKRDLAVSFFLYIPNQCIYPADIVRNHRQAVVENVINGNQRDIAVNQLPHLGIGKVNTSIDNAVHAPE